MSWNERRPDGGTPVSELADILRANKQALIDGLEQSLYFSDSTSSAGLTRLSTRTGGARAFYVAASAVSAGEHGALLLTSDTLRLFSLTSADSLLIGGRHAIIRAAPPGQSDQIVANTGMLVQSGSTTGLGTGTHAISFTSTYGGVPDASVTPIATSAVSMWQAAITARNASGLSVELRYVGAAPENTSGFYWRSVGTAAL